MTSIYGGSMSSDSHWILSNGFERMHVNPLWPSMCMHTCISAMVNVRRVRGRNMCYHAPCRYTRDTFGDTTQYGGTEVLL